MAIINVSRQMGSCGGEVAEEVAEELGYTLYDKNSINSYVKNGIDDFESVISSIDEKETGIFDYFFNNSKIYNCLMASIIFGIASKGNVVIKGRCGQYILNEHSNVLNIRVIAPAKNRSAKISEKEQIDDRLAIKLMDANDEEKKGFIKYLFNEDIEDPLFYDIVFNTNKFNKQMIKDIVVNQATFIDDKFVHQGDRFKALSTAKLVEASIIKASSEPSFFNVECFKDSQVIITGFVKSSTEKEAIHNIASEVKGVKELKNDLIIMHKF